jgi:spore coat protein CotF
LPYGIAENEALWRKEENMILTQKERTLLEDLKGAEQLCILKYTKYAEEACDPCLSNLFSSIKTHEAGHLATITKILAGDDVTAEQPKSATEEKFTCEKSSCSEEAKKEDAYLCKDALSMEKHVSSLYDTSIFEFTSPTLRDTLNHIQKEEQNHGEKLYGYMAINGMYA